jgi:WD40 repeat protein
MVMAISLFPHPSNQHLTVIAGYESGHTSVSQLSSASQTWHVLYTAQPHSQPILSLDVSPCKDSYLTSSADAIIAQHPIPDVSADDDQVVIRKAKEGTPLKTLQTKHAGQQGLRVRNDAKIFATAGWDSKVRVYALKSLKELAVLKWHKDGCYAVAFADVDGVGGTSAEKEEEGALVKRGGGALTVKEERIRRAKRTHWLVAGSKDGKVSLWDIY